MADTRVQVVTEDWIRCEWMLRRYGRYFSSERANLSSGGVFSFDAVSDGGAIVANISTSGLKTAHGSHGSGKVLKVRSDLFFLLLAESTRKLMLLTETDMHEYWLKEAGNGRVPGCIEFVHVSIPRDLDLKLMNDPGSGGLHVAGRAIPALHPNPPRASPVHRCHGPAGRIPAPGRDDSRESLLPPNRAG